MTKNISTFGVIAVLPLMGLIGTVVPGFVSAQEAFNKAAAGESCLIDMFCAAALTIASLGMAAMTGVCVKEAIQESREEEQRPNGPQQ